MLLSERNLTNAFLTTRVRGCFLFAGLAASVRMIGLAAIILDIGFCAFFVFGSLFLQLPCFLSVGSTRVSTVLSGSQRFPFSSALFDKIEMPIKGDLRAVTHPSGDVVGHRGTFSATSNEFAW